MLNLPEKTLYDKRIPKSKFYEKLKMGSKLKEKFVRQIDYIIWKHKLSRHTVNITPTPEVQEIQIFEVYLKQRELAQDVLESIDRAIPYPILFVLVYGKEARLAVAYKKRSQQHENRFVVDSYFYSEWRNELSLDLLKGLTLKAVYENLLKSLISVSPGSGQALEQAIEKQKELDKLKREIGALEAKIARERQFNRKVKYNIELQEKKKELQRLIE
ncbi:MAG: DUF4391 domain-containing protein [Dethiobacteria bacterium]|jgi:hypothetical protein